MKKTLLILILSLGLFSLKAQNITLATEYPFLQKNPITGVQEVVFNIDQGNKINNMFEVLSIMDSLIVKYKIVDDVNIKIIDKNKNILYQLDLAIDNLNQRLANKEKIIADLNAIIDDDRKDMELCNKELVKTQKSLKWQKFYTKVGFITAGALGISTLVLFFSK